MMKYFIFIGCSFIIFFHSAVAADRFSKEHICDPALSHFAISQCMTTYFEDIEKQRLDAEKKKMESAKEMQNSDRHYDKLLEKTEGSKQAFEEYRIAECERVMAAYGTGSLAGVGDIGCKITLTEQRIEKLKPGLF